MKVKFNLPISRHNSKLNFDFNTTFDFGSIQSSFCHFTVPSAKYSINLNQLVRTAPLVVPTFGRMAVHNVFAYVPMSLIYPAFDAFLSQTNVTGTEANYVPNSLPVISNRQLVCMLLSNKKFSRCHSLKTDSNSQLTVIDGHRYFNDGKLRMVILDDTSALPTGTDPFELVWDYKICDTVGNDSVLSLYKLTNLGRQFYSLFRSLGYSMDYADTSYVSVLPILAYCKAVFDLLYPHRDTPWHSTSLYELINLYYNGSFQTEEHNDHRFDLFFGLSDVGPDTPSYYSFLDAIEPYLIAPVGSDITQVATASPILQTSKAPNFDGFNYDVGGTTGTSSPINADNLIPSVEAPNAAVSADSLRLVDKLWSFVQRSSVVGQDVLNWFKVHFGAKPSEDMFCQSYLLKDCVNLLNVNTVVSSADTSAQDGEVLGGLAGQSYSAESSKVSFQAPNFGFLLCLSYVVPVCRPSNGTQPYLYNVGYYDMPFPDFDGLGYESLNSLSFQGYSDATGPKGLNTGFGFVPRLSSYKIYNNVTSGGFSLPSLRDNYLPYCLDNFVQLKNYSHFNKDMLKQGIAYNNPVTSQTLHWYYPYPDVTYKGTAHPVNKWRIFDNIFYNNSDYSDVWQLAWSPNNFMCQSSFEVNISSFLKPISDSFEIDDLFKNVTSVHKS